jgi:predicted MPP superfamily phosphohydrolase
MFGTLLNEEVVAVKVEFVETGNLEQTLIKVEGLREPVSLMHITDAHCIEVDDREGKDVLEEHLRYNEWIVRKNDYDLHGGVSPRYRVESVLKLCNFRQVDATVLTGDMMLYPSFANLDFLRQALKTLQSPYLFTLGNHDWQYRHMPWNDETRELYYPRFYEFTNNNPAFQAMEIGGIRLLAVDNSNYQITDEQLAFVREQLADGAPCLLFLHIPLYIPSLVEDIEHLWGAPIMMAAPSWQPERQSKWMVRDAEESTKSFHSMVTGGEFGNLLAIFCGHVHFSHKDEFAPGRFQYVTRAFFSGGYRWIKLVPM